MSTAHPTVATYDFWTMDRVADALSPLASVNLPRGASVFGRVWTDTRTIEPGDLFLALIGERFDAHEFLANAVAKGAAGVIVSRAEVGEAPRRARLRGERHARRARRARRPSVVARGTTPWSASSARTERRARKS